jgi:hypothetical protein
LKQGHSSKTAVDSSKQITALVAISPFLTNFDLFAKIKQTYFYKIQESKIAYVDKCAPCETKFARLIRPQFLF